LADGLAYTDNGEGRPVVLLHGLACHLGYWLRVVPLLDSVRIVALDFRGHGLSAHRDSYRYADYVDDVDSLFDRLDLEDVTLVGHSLGGYVALLAACKSDRIGRVLAIDVKSDWTDEDATFVERARAGSQRVEPERDVLVERLAKSLAPTSLGADELDQLAERALEETDGGWRFRWDRRVLAPEPVDPFAFLGRVPCPVHVIAGSESEVMPPDKARRFAEAIPSATVEVVPGAGHHPELDAPGLVAERIVQA
jgi:pimeloyl-ACP methyl ester carboxylesterase